MARTRKTSTSNVEATVLVDFIDRATDTRFHAGDVVSIALLDFDRINKQGEYFKAGRHRFGSGTCHPCSGR